jgi:hypothetical protein
MRFVSHARTSFTLAFDPLPLTTPRAEAVADPRALSCFFLFFETRIKELQRVDPDLFPRLAWARARGARAGLVHQEQDGSEHWLRLPTVSASLQDFDVSFAETAR